jgi:hypothetical protein
MDLKRTNTNISHLHMISEKIGSIEESQFNSKNYPVPHEASLESPSPPKDEE